MHSDQLQLSSQRWMTAALTAFAQGPESHDFAVHHAGIAAEHMLKAYLASLHPALIAERDFDSLLHATGHGTHASVPASRAKTIGLVDAHDRVHKILRTQMPVAKQALGPVANARNGVAHSGVYDVAEVQLVFTTCLRLIDPLLTELKIDADRYWGSYRPLHDRLIEERVEATRIRLEGRLARARAAFEERYGHLNERERALVLAAVTQQGTTLANEHSVLRTCPACSSDGWLTGDLNLGSLRGVAGPKAVVVFISPYIFDCSACGLELVDEELYELGDDFTDEVVLDDPPEDFTWDPIEWLYLEDV
ncbi:hypothetical protein OG618_36895 [Kitasatospora sp. NBC_01246]|uniref:hypothetical protein n=1 Tax=Kitasatospora sp. NBC_01246 TaxID=2903570 RepID=UPI002E33820E|nr:hypothetical protein [Kitasatospora sp. NBC_01246]